MAYVWQESVCAMACDVVSCGWAAGGEAGNAIHRSSKTPPISLPEAWALTPNGKRSWRQRCGSGVTAHEETWVDLNLSSARATVSGSGTGGRQARPAWPGPVQSKGQGAICKAVAVIPLDLLWVCPPTANTSSQGQSEQPGRRRMEGPAWRQDRLGLVRELQGKDGGPGLLRQGGASAWSAHW
ncbi:unnamed protein product [Clonostachys byssicola]|uniref:Uncharacterized protein n=1 Tax=Clonostachys byssicola TaxID=160290 RepID=A0A9N9U423_9HYPO|nr:unnamed protein product [Clonostachys byssicola]